MQSQRGYGDSSHFANYRRCHNGEHGPEQHRQAPGVGDYKRDKDGNCGKDEEDAPSRAAALVHITLNTGTDRDGVRRFIGKAREDSFDDDPGFASHQLARSANHAYLSSAVAVCRPS